MQEVAILSPAENVKTEAIIRAERIEKYYAQPSENRIQVISATDLSIVPGEIVALLGPSGSGNRPCCVCSQVFLFLRQGKCTWHEKTHRRCGD